ncbi:hypothetical protein E2C01_001620 [Portunus trituberculatus]|uniref:Uncharacterized protein n=1 Tax=Portunus trituberculatus TaxID=210409 RepID=A0A5B7CIJ1_PORTR|nr:hypothetical protein [Portunus trituberculatus]
MTVACGGHTRRGTCHRASHTATPATTHSLAAVLQLPRIGQSLKATEGCGEGRREGGWGAAQGAPAPAGVDVRTGLTVPWLECLACWFEKEVHVHVSTPHVPAKASSTLTSFHEHFTDHLTVLVFFAASLVFTTARRPPLQWRLMCLLKPLLYTQGSN